MSADYNESTLYATSDSCAQEPPGKNGQCPTRNQPARFGLCLDFWQIVVYLFQRPWSKIDGCRLSEEVVRTVFNVEDSILSILDEINLLKPSGFFTYRQV